MLLFGKNVTYADGYGFSGVVQESIVILFDSEYGKESSRENRTRTKPSLEF